MLPLRCLVFRSRPAAVTGILVAINGLVFVYELWLGSSLPVFVRETGFYSGQFTYAILENRSPDWIPVFTSMFVHGGWMHLAGNMLFLWVFGVCVEERLGHARYLALYLAAGVVAAISQVLATPYDVVPMIGASGAVAGGLGAYLFLFPYIRVRSLFFAVVMFFIWDVPAPVFLLVWFAFQLISGAASLETGQALQLGVAYFAHVGGFLAGCLLAVGLRIARPHRPIYVWRGAFGRPYYTR